MASSVIPVSVDIASEGWVERCRYWQSVDEASASPSRRRSIRGRQPLVLSGHGMHLRVRHGALAIRNGFTHYPQKLDEHRFFPGSRNLPSRIVIIASSGSLSLDVLTWLSEQDIPLVKLDWKGTVVSILGSAHALEWQRVFEQQQAWDRRRVRTATHFIRLKLQNSLHTLRSGIPASHSRSAAMEHIAADLKSLVVRPPKTIRELLGVEGRAAYAYFSAWQGLPLKWKGTGRHPIPADWHFVGPRRSRVGNKTGSRNRRASHPINAMLNYAYAVLESQIRIQIACAGMDPNIGFLHGSTHRKDAFVLDLMESMRPVVDCAVLHLLQKHTFSPADFVLRRDGVCRLNPELARMVARTTMQELITLTAVLNGPIPASKGTPARPFRCAKQT